MATGIPTDAIRNTAGSSKSPYVRRHADSPVAWQPLSQESLDRAALENKLVFLNIGSAPCHYAQLMGQDSWSRPAVANILNQHYIPIMVDRDERPDLDSIYAHYLMSIHGKAGYPMNLFLTSKLHPVYGDTYLEGPTDNVYDEGGEDNPNIVFILKRVEKHWREEKERLLAEGQATFSQLREILAEGTRSQPSTSAPGPADPVAVDIELEIMEEAYTGHAKLYDPVNAGFLSVPTDPTMPTIIPKFSMVSRLDYLLRLSHLPPAVRGVVGDSECEKATKMTLDTLRKMRDLTMHDHLSGGFHSSTQTRDWAFPLFDKVTGHNGQLLDLYLDAWLSTSSPDARKDINTSTVWRCDKNEFLDIVISLASYLISPPICSQSRGGFYTSEAADSPARNASQLRPGAFYVWSKKDFLAAIDGVANGELAASFFNVKSGGNIDKVLDPRDEFIMENVLSIVGDEDQLAGRHGISPVDARRDLAKAKEALRKYKETNRTCPATDRRVIAAENGKVIAALSRTGATLSMIGSEFGDKCLTAATKAATFILMTMWDASSQILYRICGDDNERQDIAGFAEDYAFLIDGLLNLYEATSNRAWLSWADELQQIQINLFYDPRVGPPTTPTDDFARCGGFYSSQANQADTIIRVKSAMDDVSSSVNGVSASNLFRLASLLRDDKYLRLARETILAFEVEMPVHPGLFTSLLINLATAKMGGSAWLVFGPLPTDAQAAGAASEGTSRMGMEAGTAGTTNGPRGGGGGMVDGHRKVNGKTDTEMMGDVGQNGPSDNDSTRKVKAEELRRKFFAAPRAGLRTLVQVDTSDRYHNASTSWLKSRNKFIRELLEGGGGFDPELAYVFDEETKSYRACTSEDLAVLA